MMKPVLQDYLWPQAYLMYLIDAPCIVKDTLSEGCLATVNVSRDSDIAQVLNALLRA